MSSPHLFIYNFHHLDNYYDFFKEKFVTLQRTLTETLERRRLILQQKENNRNEMMSLQRQLDELNSDELPKGG